MKFRIFKDACQAALDRVEVDTNEPSTTKMRTFARQLNDCADMARVHASKIERLLDRHDLRLSLLTRSTVVRLTNDLERFKQVARKWRRTASRVHELAGLRDRMAFIARRDQINPLIPVSRRPPSH